MAKVTNSEGCGVSVSAHCRKTPKRRANRSRSRSNLTKKSRRRRSRSRSKRRAGKNSLTPFIFYLKIYVKRHPGCSREKLIQNAARCWCSMSSMGRQRFIRASRRSSRKRRRSRSRKHLKSKRGRSRRRSRSRKRRSHGIC